MTRAIFPILATAAATVLLAGCGGSSDKPSTDGDGPPSLSSLTDTIGCTNVEPDTELVGVREAGSCDLGGATLYVYTYPTDKQRADMAEVSRLGGGVWVVGDAWEVQAPGQGAAEKVASATGGEVE